MKYKATIFLPTGKREFIITADNAAEARTKANNMSPVSGCKITVRKDSGPTDREVMKRNFPDPPKYKAGQRLVYVAKGFPFPLDDKMVVAKKKPTRNNYGGQSNPMFGEWMYEIEGKANPSHESCLRPWVEGQKEYK